MKILFVCKHNRFRSKVAEVLFKKYNKRIKVKSAGTCLDYIPVSENVVKALKEFGVKRINRKPKKITKGMISDSDLIVIVADNVSRKEIPGNKKIIRWKISDVSQEDYEGILKIIKLIDIKIGKLMRDLERRSFKN